MIFPVYHHASEVFEFAISQVRNEATKPKRKNFCPDGAMSPKPTGLLLLNLPKMLQVLRSSQITPGIPCGTSIGRDHDGT